MSTNQNSYLLQSMIELLRYYHHINVYKHDVNYYILVKEGLYVYFIYEYCLCRIYMYVEMLHCYLLKITFNVEIEYIEPILLRLWFVTVTAA